MRHSSMSPPVGTLKAIVLRSEEDDECHPEDHEPPPLGEAAQCAVRIGGGLCRRRL